MVRTRLLSRSIADEAYRGRMGTPTEPPDALYTRDDDDRAHPPETELPADLRDEVEAAAEDLRDPVSASAQLPAEGRPSATTYPPPEVVERPHEARPPGAPQPTLDPSLSRAVDRIAAGHDPHDAGYDPDGYGPAPDDPSR